MRFQMFASEISEVNVVNPENLLRAERLITGTSNEEYMYIKSELPA